MTHLEKKFLLYLGIALIAFGFLIRPTPAKSDDTRETVVYTTKTASTTVLEPSRAISTTTPKLESETQLYRLALVYFPVGDPMLDVIQCESGFRQFRADGSPLISDTGDVGIAQINVATWSEKSKLLGFDIFHSAEDNLKMARYIETTSGIDQWTCAK